MKLCGQQRKYQFDYISKYCCRTAVEHFAVPMRVLDRTNWRPPLHVYPMGDELGHTNSHMCSRVTIKSWKASQVVRMFEHKTQRTAVRACVH
jgi:hypothetical protein